MLYKSILTFLRVLNTIAQMSTSRPRQTKFQDPAFRRQRAFGGSLLKKGNAREKRAVSTSLPMHVVLRSARATGSLSMLRPAHARRVDTIVRADGRKFGVRVLEFANVGNHCHLLVRAGNRRTFLRFLRSISGRIAMALTGACKGSPMEQTRFWDYRPFTRIVEGLRGYRVARDYVELNRLEAAGIVPHRRRAPLRETG